MHKVDSTGATGDNHFQDGAGGSPRTLLGAKWLNSVQGELVAIVEKTGGTLADTDNEQIVSRILVTAADVTELRSFPIAGNTHKFRVIVESVSGAASIYTWNNTSTATDDGSTVIRPATNPSAGRWLLVSTNATNAPNQLQTSNDTHIANTAFVKAAIAALLGTVPGVLDTLQEIDAALNNDPNFATNIINSIALKAPLASPLFTGSPQGPTAAAGTSNTQFATTNFVMLAIGVILGSAPANLNTLQKLAAAIGNDQSFSTNTAASLALKLAWTNGGFNTPTITLSQSAPPAPGQAGRIWCRW